MSSDVRRIDAATAADRRAEEVRASQVDLSVDLGGVPLDNPITTASGCFASGAEIDRFFDVTELGAITVKSLTLEPREGLPTPRMAETPSGMLNAIGLQNPGVDRWLTRDLPWLQGKDAKVIASIAGSTVDEFREVARRLRRATGVVAVEVNLSCPNVEHRGLVFACDPRASAEVITAVAREVDVPVFAKLTSDVTDVVAVAEACVQAGATGLTLINTLLGMSIDPDSGRARLFNGYGGLSGPAIRPVAVRNVHQVHTAMPDVPIIGTGGVRTVEDVIEMVRAGATIVAVGTSTFVDPFTARDLARGLAGWLAEREYGSIAELRGVVTAW
jgi:dihydroorotate dehydrogenase (NAD+) catalytic subunit